MGVKTKDQIGTKNSSNAALHGDTASAGAGSAGNGAVGNGPMLSAVSTLLALTPRGRSEELARLTALAHGFIGFSQEEELVVLAKAVANRDDISEGLSDRLARTSLRAAHTLIKAGKLRDESLAYFLQEGDEETQVLIARHQPLAGEHITMLVAKGNGAILQELLKSRQTELSAEAKQSLEQKAQEFSAPHDSTASQAQDADVFVAPEPALSAGQSDAAKKDAEHTSDPSALMGTFATMDGAGRRAVLRRLAEDGHAPTLSEGPSNTISMADARKALDPTRHDEDLQFLTVIEQRDMKLLAQTFSKVVALDLDLVTKLMDEADGDAMIVLAKASGMSSTAFARLIILSKFGLTGSPRDTFALVDRFRALPQATAKYVVDAMRAQRSTASGTAPKLATPQADRLRETREGLGAASAPKRADAQGFRRAV